MFVTDEMYDLFKAAAFNPEANALPLREAMKLGIGAAVKAEIEKRDHLIKQAVEIVDEVLPQAGRITMDWGKVNDFLCAART